MPTYDYSCSSCGHAFEAVQAMSAPKKRKCPACGRPSLVRHLGAGAGVIFKGSGFYETDYKRASKPGRDAKPASEGGTEGTAKAADGAAPAPKGGSAAPEKAAGGASS
jgi:putative FmdB family regulatory protein